MLCHVCFIKAHLFKAQVFYMMKKIVFSSHFMYLNYQKIFVVFCVLRLKCGDEEHKL